MEETFLLFYVTHPDEVTARSIATVLLQERLVAWLVQKPHFCQTHVIGSVFFFRPVCHSVVR